MSDQPQQFNAQDAVNQAKDYAQQNPDMARSGIDKVEDFLDAKTGGKYADAIDKAGDWVEGQLGLPNNTNNPAPTDPEAPADPAPPAAPGEPVDPPAGR